MERRQRLKSFFVMIIVVIQLLCLIQALAAVAPATTSSSCQYFCGDLQIEFPFGIGEGCFFNKSFEVSCNDSKPFLTSINMELDVFWSDGQVRTLNPVISSNCNQNSNYNASTGSKISLLGTPFVFSNVSNSFTALGCNNYTMLEGARDTIGGCLSVCPNGSYKNGTGGCYGINCCQASIPPDLQAFRVNMTDPFSSTGLHNTCASECNELLPYYSLR